MFLRTLLVVAALLAGCAGKPTPAPPKPLVVPARTLEIDLQAEAGLNFDARDRSAPLVVRVYELRAPVNFQAADFFTLFERDQSALGNDIVSREELQLRPGESRRLTRELKPESRVVGVFAAYRDLERATWRAMLTLPEPPAPTANPPLAPIPVPVRVVLGPREVRISGR